MFNGKCLTCNDYFWTKLPQNTKKWRQKISFGHTFWTKANFSIPLSLLILLKRPIILLIKYGYDMALYCQDSGLYCWPCTQQGKFRSAIEKGFRKMHLSLSFHLHSWKCWQGVIPIALYYCTIACYQVYHDRVYILYL